ncbi:hypothetical protein [Puniceicoccus vermicola]|uniref:Cytochrome oxidase subunit I profile domain-containing protein n=1 Tax=Puniceicoccus vermicola TaxID=388746 RepID=A0A7X1B1L6_9BACT|nr:hypothetical protein [Puniceicoccus vermicola]MBC2603959.1 hypothetical protein [Puniceicoccus vermicola]
MEPDLLWSRRLQRATGIYSLGWLLLANLVGLWLATLLVWPGAGKWVGELTYGRWMPLHMDWQLYGWCSLPLVGLLMSFFLKSGDGAEVHLGFLSWSTALVVGGALSLLGVVSGKLFLNWAGVGRVVFPAAQVLLWGILVAASWRRWRTCRRWDRVQSLHAVLLIVLLASPIALFLTSGSETYPPIDPESGGATGHSLLASSLGMIGIFGILPWVLRVPRVGAGRKIVRVYAGAFIVSLGIWAVLDHGNASNRSIGQNLGLGVLLGWVPLTLAYYRAFAWQGAIRRWLWAFLFWWGLLTLTGFITFLPGVLDWLKFTNGLVAHAHLAMAGMVSALNMLILGSLGKSGKGDPWADASAFWIWQVGTLLYVVSMMVQGVREGLDPTVLFGPNPTTEVFYRFRWFAGVLLVSANLRWIYCLARGWLVRPVVAEVLVKGVCRG